MRGGGRFITDYISAIPFGRPSRPCGLPSTPEEEEEEEEGIFAFWAQTGGNRRGLMAEMTLFRFPV